MTRKRIMALILVIVVLAGSIMPAIAAEIRISGENRYETAAKISQEVYDSSEYAILANGLKFVDALPGATLANILEAPILLVTQKSVPNETKSELERLEVQKIYILGGEATIEKSVEDALIKEGYEVTRIGGADRYETSELIFEEAKKFGEIDAVTIASNEADAVSSSGFRGKNIALILINKSNPSEFIRQLQIKKICLGGINSISEETFKAINADQRIAGENRFETAANIAKESNKDNIILVNGYSFVDAFTGSTLAYQKGADILLADNVGLPKETTDYISEVKPKDVYVIGGERSVTPKAIEQAEEALTGVTPPETEVPPTTDESDWAKIYKEVLRGEREVLVSTVNDNNVRTKLQPKYTNFNLLDFDGNGIPELVINSKMSYWDESISKSYQPIVNLTNWVNAYVYTVRNGELVPLFLANDQMSSAVNFHYIGFTDNGYKLYSELNMLFTGAFRTHELIDSEMRITDKTGYSADSERPTIFRNNDVEVKASVYNDKKFEYHNGRYDFESYPANEDNLKAVIDGYPAKIQKKPSQDWRGAYRNLLTKGEGFIRVEQDRLNGIINMYPPYNHSINTITGNNRWFEQSDIKKFGILDVNNDGKPELIITGKSPHPGSNPGEMIQIFTYIDGYTIPKLILSTLTKPSYMERNGFILKDNAIAINNSSDQILAYYVYNINTDTSHINQKIDGRVDIVDNEYQYNYVRRTTYTIDQNQVVEDLDHLTCKTIIETNLQNMVTLDEILVPLTQKNIELKLSN